MKFLVQAYICSSVYHSKGVSNPIGISTDDVVGGLRCEG